MRRELFVPFRRAPGTGNGGSLGLGLYIVEQFVLAHGGRVEGGSAEGSTRFEVRIPRHAG